MHWDEERVNTATNIFLVSPNSEDPRVSNVLVEAEDEYEFAIRMIHVGEHFDFMVDSEFKMNFEIFAVFSPEDVNLGTIGSHLVTEHGVCKRLGSFTSGHLTECEINAEDPDDPTEDIKLILSNFTQMFRKAQSFANDKLGSS